MVSIWQSQRQKYSGTYFRTRCTRFKRINSDTFITNCRTLTGLTLVDVWTVVGCRQTAVQAVLHSTFLTALVLLDLSSAFCDRPMEQGRPLYFCPVSFFFLSFFPHLSDCRIILQIGCLYRTSIHGVALVRIQNAGLRCAARGSLKIQDAKNLGTIPQLCQAISSQLRHVSTIGKKVVKQQYLLHMCSQYGELPPTSV